MQIENVIEAESSNRQNTEKKQQYRLITVLTQHPHNKVPVS